MMWNAWLWFVSWGWLYCMIIMSVILTVQLIIHWKDWDSLRKLGAFTVIVLTLHVWEEWVIPGGFHYIYNIASQPSLRGLYPMSKITDMITNFGGAILWFILVQAKKYGRKMSFAVMIFSYFEFIIHMYLAHHSMAVLANLGIHTGFYAPGLVTAICCWLPLGIAYTVWFVSNKVKLKDAIGGIVILVVLSVLLVNMPEKLLKSKDNPYGWTDQGYYEQYIEKMDTK
jgi:hypothetical protein